MKKTLLFVLLTLPCVISFSQDTITSGSGHTKHTKEKQYIPEVAALQSAILPGLGQVYNRQYWRIPLAIAAVGIPVRTHIRLRKLHDEASYAVEFSHMIQTDPSKEPLKELLAPEFLASYENSKNDGGIIKFRTRAMSARKEYLQNRDFALVWTIIMWGLNVIDATTSAHLKGFDINDNISMNIQPAFQSDTKTAGIKMILSYNK